MNRNNIEVRLLVKGRPITEYFHNGNTFIEGRENSKFEIELINHNPFRVEAIVSVDGLSVIDGKDASDRSSGYLLESGQTLRVPGWKLDNAQVAAFVFSGRGNSYAAQSTGSARNSGVIGVMAYREKVNHTYHSFSYTVNNALPNAFPGGGHQVKRMKGIARGIAPTGGTAGDFHTRGIVGSTVTGYDPLLASGNITCGSTMSMNNATIQTSFSPDVAVASAAAAAAPALNNLGTGFGEVQDFATTTVDFQRGDLLAVAILYYDNSRGLKARGIQISRPSRARYHQEPQAFPGMHSGCTPPPGWNG